MCAFFSLPTCDLCACNNFIFCVTFFCCLLQGFTAALFSMPFDLIKSRLMAQKPDPVTGKLQYAGVLDCTAQIFKKEGPAGFFGGFSAYYGRCAPHAMIILLWIEGITKGYKNLLGLN